jgi:hypothetical protein
MKHGIFQISSAVLLGLIVGLFLPEVRWDGEVKEPVPQVYSDPIIAPAFQTVKPIEMELGVQVTSITVSSLVERLNEAGDPESVVVFATPDGFATINEIGAFDVSASSAGKPVIILGKDLGGWVKKNFPSGK